LSTTSPTDSTAFCAPSLTVSFADLTVSFVDLPAFRALDEPFLAVDDAFEREPLAARLERLESAPLRELARARVELPFDEPLLAVLLLRVPALLLRVPEDFEDEFRALLVLVCAIALSFLLKSVQSQCDTRRHRI
jgi:hypothetical protein